MWWAKLLSLYQEFNIETIISNMFKSRENDHTSRVICIQWKRSLHIVHYFNVDGARRYSLAVILVGTHYYIIGDVWARTTRRNDIRVSAGVRDPLVVCRLWEGSTLTSNLHRFSDLYLKIGMLDGGRAKLDGRSMCRSTPYAKAD
jgi:hypothetical protein